MAKTTTAKGTILVTGGARRIGRAICLELARAGYDIALHYNRSRGEAQRTAAAVQKTGRMCRLFPCDLSDPAQVEGLIPAVFAECRNLTGLVNNASVFEPSDPNDKGTQVLHRHLSVNFRAPYVLMQQFARRVRKGNIVNILDANMAKARTAFAEYTLSKRMLGEWGQLAAKKFSPAIRVNAVAPGLILPPEGKAKDYLNDLIRRVPLQRKGNPADVAKAVLFLVESNFVTGQVIYADGGEHLV